tara:strand:+ start:5061 stop:6170 length:1110 start_codon:yes stop_codon:yes gene_type:complete
MVTAHLGVASSQLSSVANRVLIDYKDAIQDYKVTGMPVVSLFAESFTTETGGDVDITFSRPSMKLEQLEEGATPAFQHSDLRSERVSVKEWGIAVGVTRRMLEDSRFSEMELALNEARRAVERHVTEHFVKALFGLGDSGFGTGISNADITAASTEAAVTTFANNAHGGFFGTLDNNGTGGLDTANDVRVAEYGIYSKDDLAALGPVSTGSHYFVAQDSESPTASDDATGDIALNDITAAMELIGAKGLNADTVMISPMHYKTLLNLADFTTPFGTSNSSKGGLDYVNQTSRSGAVGQLYGLNIVMNAYIPKNRFGVFDMSVKPMAYVERRGLTVEEANPGFGITGSYMSMRYGLKVIRPEAGIIVIGD